ncbi:Hypothetical protein PFCIRM138_01245 [Propionibacterium freudenreichii subsp. freudenreichii]|uniref:Uncharacterized protein n=2 Tax=Propionibacterium freudenreichii TaxID=1744 RepID=D7GEI3_PROFC|nr:Hypothetical protein PFREUD_14450 [Propionibacterium freudenreichii subsp. shermanii CIRM-BIA1]CEI28575.1 Hypothetical protein PFCIRM516_00695 [Propionibacterium freudenreichii]CEP27370.1 Hypothetical protein PFCIRM138_01245 [Propionibacterium freudenreichii subsp. freudenreichii]
MKRCLTMAVPHRGQGCPSRP